MRELNFLFLTANLYARIKQKEIRIAGCAASSHTMESETRHIVKAQNNLFQTHFYNWKTLGEWIINFVGYIALIWRHSPLQILRLNEFEQ